MADFSNTTTDLNASSTSPPLKMKTTKTKTKTKNKNRNRDEYGNNRNDSDATINTKKNENDPNETAKSSQKPQLKIVRNNLGSLVILFFGVLLDLYVLGYNTFYTYRYGLFKLHNLMGGQRNTLFVCFVAFVSSILSLLFTLAIISISGLTRLHQKRVKAAPYLVFGFFKLVLFAWQGMYTIFFCLFVKDFLLYACISHTTKNKIVRKFFKPYKQVVYYD